MLNGAQGADAAGAAAHRVLCPGVVDHGVSCVLTSEFYRMGRPFPIPPCAG
jgi:hypothetical protein